MRMAAARPRQALALLFLAGAVLQAARADTAEVMVDTLTVYTFEPASQFGAPRVYFQCDGDAAQTVFPEVTDSMPHDLHVAVTHLPTEDAKTCQFVQENRMGGDDAALGDPFDLSKQMFRDVGQDRPLVITASDSSFTGLFSCLACFADSPTPGPTEPPAEPTPSPTPASPTPTPAPPDDVHTFWRVVSERGGPFVDASGKHLWSLSQVAFYAEQDCSGALLPAKSDAQLDLDVWKKRGQLSQQGQLYADTPLTTFWWEAAEGSDGGSEVVVELASPGAVGCVELASPADLVDHFAASLTLAASDDGGQTWQGVFSWPEVPNDQAQRILSVGEPPEPGHGTPAPDTPGPRTPSPSTPDPSTPTPAPHPTPGTGDGKRRSGCVAGRVFLTLFIIGAVGGIAAFIYRGFAGAAQTRRGQPLEGQEYDPFEGGTGGAPPGAGPFGFDGEAAPATRGMGASAASATSQAWAGVRSSASWAASAVGGLYGRLRGQPTRPAPRGYDQLGL